MKLFIIFLSVLFGFFTTLTFASTEADSNEAGLLGLKARSILQDKPIEAVVVVDGTLEHMFSKKEESTFHTNHEYLIVGFEPHPNVRFLIEVIEVIYWEFQYSLSPRSKIKVGKIAIPFGPVFLHQVLAGVVEKPLIGGGQRHFMVPHVWAEYGIGWDQVIYDGFAYNLKGKLFLVNGLNGQIRQEDRTVEFSTSTAGLQDENRDKGIGFRINQKFYGKYALNFSGYSSMWANENENKQGEYFYEGDRMYLGNVDIELGYNSIPLPLLKNMRIRAEYALIRVRSRQNIAGARSHIPWHNKSANLLELTYNGFHKWFDIQFRYGTYDDNWDVVNNRDLVNYNISLYMELLPGIHIIPMYMWNREKVNEVDDDFFFFKFFIEL
jgi:hypothetical protein